MTYRTVHTAESDQLFPIAPSKLDRYMYDGIDAEVGGDPSFPEQLLHGTYKNVVLTDKNKYDGALVDQIRADFNEYIESMGMEVEGTKPRYAVCLVIGEKCQRSIIDAPEPDQVTLHGPKGLVMMIDPRCNPESGDYVDFMRVEIQQFWFVTVELILCAMSQICPLLPLGKNRCMMRSMIPGVVPVFDGGEGKIDFEREDGTCVTCDCGERGWYDRSRDKNVH